MNQENNAVQKIDDLTSAIAELEKEIDEYADRNDNASNPISGDVIVRMNERCDRLKRKKVDALNVRIKEIKDMLGVLNNERELLESEIQEIEKHLK